MKKKRFVLISLVVVALLALVAVGTVLGQEPEEPEGSPPKPPPTPVVSPDERGETGEVLPAAAVDSAFSYQGRLTDSSGSPLSGTYHFQVQFWDEADPTSPTATQVGATNNVNDVEVSDGLFNLTVPVTHGDFNGRELYMQMRVRPDGGTWDNWTDTQPILSVPYALSLRPGATIGGTDAGNGTLYLRNSANNQTIWFMGYNGNIYLGPTSDSGVDYTDGDVFFNAGDGTQAAHIDSAPDASECVDPLGHLCTIISGGQHATHGDLTFESNDDVYFLLDQEYNSNPQFSVYRQTDATTRQHLFRVDRDGNCGADGTFTSNAWDYADMLPVAGSASELEPGDVLVISKEKDFAVELSPGSFDTSVIGIYSTKSGFLGGVDLGMQVVNGVPVAMAGVVPCKVSVENGPIQRGDLLTTSSTPGYAMRAGENPSPGTVLGKAMGKLEEGTGIIEVLVTLQ